MINDDADADDDDDDDEPHSHKVLSRQRFTDWRQRRNKNCLHDTLGPISS